MRQMKQIFEPGVGKIFPEPEQFKPKQWQEPMLDAVSSDSSYPSKGYGNPYSFPGPSTEVMTFETRDGGFFAVACHKKRAQKMKRDLQMHGYPSASWLLP